MKEMKLWKWSLLLFFGTIVFMVIYSFAQAPFILGIRPGYQIAPLIVGAIILLYAYRFWMNFLEKRDPVETSFSRLWPDVRLGFGIGFLYFVAITLTMIVIGCYSVEGINIDIEQILQNFFMMIVVAIGEEIVFRGIIYRMIADRYNMYVALVVSALLFGFLHFPNPGATVWSSFAISIEAGIMLGLAYSYRQSLWVPIGIHLSWNFSQGQIFGYAVSGMDIPSPIIQPVISGHELITGGAFGAEASVIAVVISFVISYLLYKKITVAKAE